MNRELRVDYDREAGVNYLCCMGTVLFYLPPYCLCAPCGCYFAKKMAQTRMDTQELKLNENAVHFKYTDLTFCGTVMQDKTIPLDRIQDIQIVSGNCCSMNITNLVIDSGSSTDIVYSVSNGSDVRDFILAKKNAHDNSFVNVSGVTTVTGGGSVADELVKITNLRNQGVLNETEYSNLKTKLLS